MPKLGRHVHRKRSTAKKARCAQAAHGYKVGAWPPRAGCRCLARPDEAHTAAGPLRQLAPRDATSRASCARACYAGSCVRVSGAAECRRQPWGSQAHHSTALQQAAEELLPPPSRHRQASSKKAKRGQRRHREAHHNEKKAGK